MCDVPSIKVIFLYFYFFVTEVYVSLMMALAGIELETLISEPDTLTTRPPPCVFYFFVFYAYEHLNIRQFYNT